MSDGHYTLADAGAYCGRTGNPASRARWARRHLLPNLPYIQLPGAGILLRRSDIDGYLQKYLVAPIDLDAIVRAVVPKRTPARGGKGRYEQKEVANIPRAVSDGA